MTALMAALTATGRRVTVYNPLLCERVATLAEATDPIQGICATMPGLLVTSDTGGHVRVFDSTCHELLQTIQLVPSGMLPPPNYPNYPNELLQTIQLEPSGMLLRGVSP